jgi:GNAT superfamily N-acetyltransferase
MGTARPAVLADVPRLAALCRQALAEMAPARGGAVFVQREAQAEPLEERFAAALADPTKAMFAGIFDAVMLGYAAVTDETLRDGSSLAVVTDLYVEPAAREVGVGEALMDALIEWATVRGCAGVDATALPGDRLTKNFFESNGFTARLLIMHRRLEGDVDEPVQSVVSEEPARP